MFKELIYTRCRQGINLLTGQTLTGDGFKVYACTPSLLDTNQIDLPLLLNAAQRKQPYKDPEFMEDAYLYSVPDIGQSYLTGFYPVPFVPNADADFSNRPGNFINQILIGDYSNLYPYLLFRNPRIWTAKTKEDAYYYHNEPEPLPERADLAAADITSWDKELRDFVLDGRRQALMAAIAFIITQFELPVEARKFLIIRDQSAQMIELWIAAIESAFSARIAASISFATRFSRYSSDNRYTVNREGLYQAQINLQDPNQKQRLRALIVGVDDRDREGAAAVRPLANAPYAVLDGREKKALFDIDTSDPFFSFVTAWDVNHLNYCRDFLQSLDIVEPTSGIFQLRAIYLALQPGSRLLDAQEVADLLKILGQYPIVRADGFLADLYGRLKADMPRFIVEDLSASISIIDWLAGIAPQVDTRTSAGEFSDLVYDIFLDKVLGGVNLREAELYWQTLKGSRFGPGAARALMKSLPGEEFRALLDRIQGLEALVLALIYLDAMALLQDTDFKKIAFFADIGLRESYALDDMSAARLLIEVLALGGSPPADAVILALMGQGPAEYDRFLVKCFLELQPSIVQSDSMLVEFFRLNPKAASVSAVNQELISARLARLRTGREIRMFVAVINQLPRTEEDYRIKLFEELDQMLPFGDRDSMETALLLLKMKPDKAICVNSAHLAAYDSASSRLGRPQLIDQLFALTDQGFPSLKDPAYIETLVKNLMKARLRPDELQSLIRLFTSSAPYTAELVGSIISQTTARQYEGWNTLLETAVEIDHPVLRGELTAALKGLKRREKAWHQLASLIRSDQSERYFQAIVATVQKEEGGRRRFLGY